MAQIILDSNNNLIQGDFDNATLNNRTKLQTTTTNATTNVYVVPNGSSTSAGVSVANNSSLTNASKIVMATNGTTDTQIISGVNGSGSYLPLSFYTNNALAMQVATSGYVGIGTSSPGAPLDVQATNGANSFYLTSTTGTNPVYSRYSNTGGFLYMGRDGSAGTDFGAGAYASALWSTGAYPMVFGTNATERMRIDSSGNVLMGVTAQRYGTCKLVAEATSLQAAFLGTNYAGDVSNAAVYISKYDNNTTTSQIFVRFLINNITLGSGQINANGASAAAFGSFSDERLKENIEPLSSQLDNILALKPSEFDFKGYTDGMGHQIGFIAQDMQKVYPDVVSEGEDGMLMITGWSKTEARLVKAIQEQQVIINELKTRIEALESK
jgi:hypothetical protein